MMNLRKEDFAFDLPPELIALEPAQPRGASRLLQLDQLGQPSNQRFLDLVYLLPPKTLILLNNTKVIPARLVGQRATGGQLEVLLLRQTAPQTWLCKVKNSAKLKPQERITLAEGRLQAEVLEKQPGCLLRFVSPDLLHDLERYGLPPLPPYILQARGKNNQLPGDLENYQTCFAQTPGAIAAPTAGLHFTPEAMRTLAQAGHEFASLTLHVGLGTFEPLREEQISQKKLHPEELYLTPETADRINQAHAAGRPILAVGTTSLRALEAATQGGQVLPGHRTTDLFITPPHRFEIPTHLLTNFHLPESSLLMLVCAFGGQEQVLAAYRWAIEQRYRFYSFGDCMLVPQGKGA